MKQDFPAGICTLCRATDAKLLFVKAATPYFKCRYCQFVFSSPASNANFQTSLGDYEDAYLQYLSSDLADRRNFDEVWSWMQIYSRMEKPRLLDVGSGSGKWVRYLRTKEVEAIGLETSSTLYDHFLAHENYFLHTTIEDSELSDHGPFDVITIFDVLEHVEDPLGMLSRAATLLSPSGWLFFSLPDVGSLTARVMGKHWHHFNRYHLSFFNRSTLMATGHILGLESTGFCHRGRYRSMGYVARYLFEILLRRKSPAFVKKLDEWYVPINIFLTQCVWRYKRRISV